MTIPATSAGTFSCAFAPRRSGKVSCEPTTAARPQRRASSTTGANPPHETRFGSSNTADAQSVGRRSPTRSSAEPKDIDGAAAAVGQDLRHFTALRRGRDLLQVAACRPRPRAASGSEAEEHDESPRELDQRPYPQPSDDCAGVAPSNSGHRFDHQDAAAIVAVLLVRSDRRP